MCTYMSEGKLKTKKLGNFINALIVSEILGVGMHVVLLKYKLLPSGNNIFKLLNFEICAGMK